VCGPGLSRLEAIEQLQYLVLGVRGQCVPSPVHGNAGASREVIVEPYVGSPRMIELDIPVAECRYFSVDFVAQRYLRKSGAVGRCRPDWE